MHMVFVSLMFSVGGSPGATAHNDTQDKGFSVTFVVNGMPNHIYLAEIDGNGEISTRHGIRTAKSIERPVTFERTIAGKKGQLSSPQLAELQELARMVVEAELPSRSAQYLGGWIVEFRTSKRFISIHLADLEKQLPELKKLVEAIRRYSPIPIDLKSWS